MRKQIKLLFFALILFFNFSSLGFCIEPKFFWTIYIDEFNSTTKTTDVLYSLNFKEIYKNQDWMEYKIANSGWVCELKAISEGDSPKFKSYDYGLLGIVERVTVSCSRDNWRNVVFRSLQCRMFDTGNDEVKVIQS
jgi:hypothetical protein